LRQLGTAKRQRASAAHPQRVNSLAGLNANLYVNRMERMFEIADRAWLPWRFFGAMCSVLARLWCGLDRCVRTPPIFL